jgi:formylglycine-generating enzyme required for sulfatase activity
MISLPGFSVEEPLGRGRTGTVYQARRDADGALFALRHLPGALASKPGVLDALRELAASSASLRRPVAIPVVEVLEQDGDIFVVEPLVRGTPLSAELADGALHEAVVESLANDLMDAVADLHRQRIVHGDIRPSNIFMTEHGPRLLGAGVALRTHRRTGQSGFLSRDPYDAPELDEGKPSHLTDVYALGAVLMYALIGEEGPYHFLSETDGLRDVLLDAMAPNPADRPANVEALRDAFARGLRNRGRLRKREQTGPVITSWGAPTRPSPPLDAAPQFAFPEEDDLATRGSMPAAPGSAFPSDSPRLKAMEEELARERAAAKARADQGRSFAAAARPEAPSHGTRAPAADEGAKWHVVDLTDDDPEQARPLVDIEIEGSMVSARKPGTKAPGERAAELMDWVRSHRAVSGGAGVAGVVLLLLVMLWPDHPPEMMRIEGGPSVPVGDPEGQRDERPGTTAAVTSFLIDRSEVRVADYRTCMQTQGCSAPARPLPDDGDLPVTTVSWIQAQAYCRSLGKRLPTENEWEATARRGGRFPWGDEPPSCTRAHYGRLEGGPCAEEGVPAAVVALPTAEQLAEDDGLVHVLGNVWEFVDTDYEPARGPGSGGPSVPGRSALRVIKGGAFGSAPSELRPGGRIGVRSDYWAEDVGFRCAR